MNFSKFYLTLLLIVALWAMSNLPGFTQQQTLAHQQGTVRVAVAAQPTGFEP